MNVLSTCLVARLRLWAAVALALTGPLAAHAQSAPQDGPVSPRATSARAAAEAPRLPLPDQVTVIEDEGARIEETRRRGQVVRVQVQSKVGNTRSYDIVVKPGAEPASQQRGSAGRSAWQLFSF